MWWKKSTCISTKLNELQVSRYPEDHAIDESFDWTMKFFKNSCFSNFLHLGRICLNNKTTDTNKVVYSTVPWAGHPRKTMAGVEQVNFPSKALQRTWHTQTMARSEDWVPSKRFSQMFVPQRWRVKECKSNPWHCFGICFVACLMWCFFGFFSEQLQSKSSWYEVRTRWQLWSPQHMDGAMSKHAHQKQRNGRNGRNTNNFTGFPVHFLGSTWQFFCFLSWDESMPAPKF